jgi:hypothetical protein
MIPSKGSLYEHQRKYASRGGRKIKIQKRPSNTLVGNGGRGVDK